MDTKTENTSGTKLNKKRRNEKMSKFKGKYFVKMKLTLVFLMTLTVLMSVGSDAAFAVGAYGGSGEKMGWEDTLGKVADSLSGPVAKALCIMMIIAGAFGIMFGGDLNGWVRWVSMAAVVGGMIGFAPALLAALGVTGMTVI
jgi:type IV secretion system protein VirB2